jgi:uncharacterized cupredoxin-like copper-binding protein
MNRSYTAMSVLVVLLTGCSMFRSAPQRELLVTVDNVAYAPNTLETEVGEEVTLTLNNVDTQEHHFAIQEISIATSGGGMGNMPGMDMSGMSGEMSEMGPMPQLHLVAAAGTSNTLEFTPTKSGEYEFNCIMPGHTESGALVVQD